MIKTLKEAIEHARFTAQKLKAEAKSWQACAVVSKGKAKSEECLECAADHEQLASWLEELDKRREADKWIPISEPPEEHDYYLVTCEFGVARATDIALFYPDREGEEQWSLNYVTAWKPLPEPYESEDKQHE